MSQAKPSRTRRARRDRRNRRRASWIAVAVGVGSLLGLAGVLLLPADDDAGGGTGTVAVSMVEYAFEPVAIHAEPGEELAVTNDGAIPHNLLVLELAKGIELAAGDAGTLALPADAAAGTYEVVCDLPGHREAGMTGTLVLS